MSMYSDIDLDADGMEMEFKAAFEELIWFVDVYLFNTGKGDFKNERAEVIFNRDRLIDETEVINNCKASIDIISDETIISMHPWVTDVKGEIEKLKKQREEQNPVDGYNDYSEDFKHTATEYQKVGNIDAGE